MNVPARRFLNRRIFTTLCLAALALFLAAPAFGAGKRDVLWDIVSTCMDTGVAD